MNYKFNTIVVINGRILCKPEKNNRVFTTGSHFFKRNAPSLLPIESQCTDSDRRIFPCATTQSAGAARP